MTGKKSPERVYAEYVLKQQKLNNIFPLGFKLEEVYDGYAMDVVMDNGERRPATDEEVALWKRYQKLMGEEKVEVK